jgi:hypothetical protein
MVDVSIIESTLATVPSPSLADVLVMLAISLIGAAVILVLGYTAMAIRDKIIEIKYRDTPPPVVGHLTQEQWLAHGDSFHGYDGTTVIQWLEARGLPPLKKEDFSPRAWRQVSRLPIGCACSAKDTSFDRD